MPWVFISSTDLGRNLSCSHWLGSWIVMLHHKLHLWDCLFSSPNNTTIQFYNQPILHQKPFLYANVPIQHTKNSPDTNKSLLWYQRCTVPHMHHRSLPLPYSWKLLSAEHVAQKWLQFTCGSGLYFLSHEWGIVIKMQRKISLFILTSITSLKSDSWLLFSVLAFSQLPKCYLLYHCSRVSLPLYT